MVVMIQISQQHMKSDDLIVDIDLNISCITMLKVSTQIYKSLAVNIACVT